MQKKFRFTEEQVKGFMKKCLTEDDMTVAYQKPSNGVISTTDMANQARNAQKQAPSARIKLEVSSEDLGVNESKNTFTKKQLNETRLKMLKKNSVSYKKSDLI